LTNVDPLKRDNTIIKYYQIENNMFKEESMYFEQDLLKRYSVNDYVQMLTDVKKVRINDTWYDNEITGYTQRMLEKIGIPVN